MAQGNPISDESMGDTISRAKEKVSDIGRNVSSQVDEKRDSAAGSLDSAASRLHQKAESLPGGPKVSGAAHNVADKMGSTADYVRSHNLGDMMDDVVDVLKKHPGTALAGAAGVGFLLGWSLRQE